MVIIFFSYCITIYQQFISWQLLIIVLQRTPSWYDNVLFSASNQSIWTENFRMPQQTITELCQLLGEAMSPSECTVREPISVMKRYVKLLFWQSY